MSGDGVIEKAAYTLKLSMRGKIKLKCAVVLFGMLGLPNVSFAAKPIMISFSSEKEGTVSIAAEDKKDGMWIDFLSLAKVLGAVSTRKRAVVMVEFSSHTVAINPRKSTFSLLHKGKKKWVNDEFPVVLAKQNIPLFVPLESLPKLCQTSFSYHRQKRVLAVVLSRQETQSTLIPATVRHEVRDQKIWLSIDDVAQALRLVSFSTQGDRISVVLPDFTILEFRNGDNVVYSRGAPYARLNDPVLLFSGLAYLTTPSLFAVFGVDAQWDSVQKELLIPAKYGRRQGIPSPSQYRLTMLGYQPRPNKYAIEEFSMFYQDPAPSYPAEHNEVYESVRDILTNEPIQQHTNDYGHVSGHTRLDMQTSFLKAPLDGRGLFEKVGPKSRAVNARLSWGFPMFRVEGGREYVTMGGLNNHFNLVDQIVVSHSNDHYGDQKVNPRFSFRGGYGEADVSVFQSTAVFSQVVDVDQKIVTGGFDLEYRYGRRNKVSLKMDQYFFHNEIRNIRGSYDNLDFLQDILGDDFDLSVDPSDQVALSKSMFSDRHMMSLAQAGYAREGVFEVSQVVGVSSYENQQGEKIRDHDHLTRLQLGKRKSRLELSYEKSGPNYRSLGNPFRYQDRQIYRVTPFLDIKRWWKVFGDYRKEDNRSTIRQGLIPNTQKYMSGVNLFSFRKDTLRTAITGFETTLYGKRLKHNADYTHTFGRDTLDVGSGVDSQRTIQGILFRRSYSGRLGYQMMREEWQVSVNQEYVRHHYYFNNKDRYSSIANALVRLNKWKVLARYEREPKYYNLPENLTTGTLRIGRQMRNKKIFDVFYAVTSEKSNLSSPEVWRSGVEYVLDFY